ncbi:MAG: HNH endonuclease [Patescibacteria group bacterium]
MGINECYTNNDKQTTLKIFNYRCANCQTKKNLGIDHHHPLSKGNPLTLQNAVPLCAKCNSSKNNKNPEDFYGTKKCRKIDKKLKSIK